MTIRLDHTIVPAKDKVASAEFYAEIFGLKVKPGPGYFEDPYGHLLEVMTVPETGS